MSKRLQVLLGEREFEEIRRLARRGKVTVASWVRDALAAARRSQPRGDASTKIHAIRAAVKNSFPTADIDRMLEEIEAGYQERRAR